MEKVAIFAPSSLSRSAAFGQLEPFGGSAPTNSLHLQAERVPADVTASVTGLATEFSALVDADIRPALQEGAIALVRPDGYLACSAADPTEIADYLQQLLQDDSGLSIGRVQ